jgi:hypothetical protein
MASKLRAGTVAALLLLAGSVTVASATSSVDSGLGSAQHKGPSGSDGHRTVILHLRSEPNRPLTDVDLGEPGFSEADQYVFANDLFSGDTKVSEEGGVCTATRVEEDGASTLHCTSTLSLRGGQINTAGLVSYGAGEEFNPDPYFFAITGRTGKYRTAHGEVRLEELGSTQLLDVTFRIIL